MAKAKEPRAPAKKSDYFEVKGDDSLQLAPAEVAPPGIKQKGAGITSRIVMRPEETGVATRTGQTTAFVDPLVGQPAEFPPAAVRHVSRRILSLGDGPGLLLADQTPHVIPIRLAQVRPLDAEHAAVVSQQPDLVELDRDEPCFDRLSAGSIGPRAAMDVSRHQHQWQ